MVTEVADPPIAERILASAITLFARKGFAATSTREIVESAGVTKPMLYYYFQSKEGLGRAALARFFEPFHEQYRQLLDRACPAEDFLTEAVWAHFRYCREHKDSARVFYALWFGPEDETVGLDMERHTDRSQRLLEETVARAVAAGLVRRGSEESFYLTLTGTINIAIMAALKSNDDLTRDLAQRMVADLMRGFGAGETSDRGDRAEAGNEKETVRGTRGRRKATKAE